MIDPVQEIKSRLDIADLVGQYVQLKKAGANYKGRCPFHDEKTPSFMVSTDKQIAYCFGCHKGGDIFNFFMEVEGVGFKEALELLAERVGYDLPKKGLDVGKKDERSKIFELNKIASQFFMHVLWNTSAGEVGRNYLEKRQVDRSLAQIFGIGMAPDKWDTLFTVLRKKGYSDKDMLAAGLIVKRENGSGFYDKFRNRLIFPIKNGAGLVVGFGGRVFSEEVSPKYLNTSETLVFHKSNLLYNFDQAKQEIRKKGVALVVEGYMDVISSWKTSVKNVVASSGTALTEEHLKMIGRITDKVAFAFDSDKAGIDAAFRAIDLALAVDMDVRIVLVPDGKDADECIKKDPALWEKACEEGIPFLDFVIQQAFKKNDSTTAEGRKNITKLVLKNIKKLRSHIQQEFYLQKLAEDLRVSVVILREEMKIVGGDEKEFISNFNKKEKNEEFVTEYTQEDYIYGIFLSNPELIKDFDELISDEYGLFSSAVSKKINKLRMDWEKGDFIKGHLDADVGPLVLKVDEIYGKLKQEAYIVELKKLIDSLRGKSDKNNLTYKISALKKAEAGGDRELILKLKEEISKMIIKKK